MRLPGTNLSNYMDSLDHTAIARMGQKTRAAKEQADILAAGTEGKGALITAGNSAINDIMMDANDYAAGQAQQAGWFDFGTDMAGLAVGTIGQMNKPPTYPGKTSDGYPLGRGSDGSYGGFGGQYGNFTPPTLLPNGNYTFG